MIFRKPAPPVPADNHTIPQKALDEIATALHCRRQAHFHGGCSGCVWKLLNTTHEGIAFCRGCRYFAWDRDLPDKSRKESAW